MTFRPTAPGDRRFARLRLRRLHRLEFAVALGLLLPCIAWSGAQAQAPAANSLNDLVLNWIQGNYASPLLCRIDGQVQRGLRRILIEPGSSKSHPAEGTLQFVDLEAERAARCFTEIGGSAPNITGELAVRHPVTKLRATATRDFKSELRRKRGFELDIIRGRLQLSEIGAAIQKTESVDFRGGKLRMHLLRQGSDGMRLLKDLPSPRKLMIEIETRSGRKLSFPVSLAKPGPQPDAASASVPGAQDPR